MYMILYFGMEVWYKLIIFSLFRNTLILLLCGNFENLSLLNCMSFEIFLHKKSCGKGIISTHSEEKH